MVVKCPVGICPTVVGDDFSPSSSIKMIINFKCCTSKEIFDEETFYNKPLKSFELRNDIYFSSSSKFKLNHANNDWIEIFDMIFIFKKWLKKSL